MVIFVGQGKPRSGQDLHCLPFIHSLCDTSSDSLINMLKIYDKDGKGFRVAPGKVLFWLKRRYFS